MPDLYDTTALETRLRRFLYIGKEIPEYQPGNWFVHDYYNTQNISSIYELALNPEKIGPIIFLIHEAFKRELVPNKETLIFAIAVCARQQTSISLRQKAYNAVEYLCVEPENFILFNKFCSQLSKSQSKNGWGKGWRRAVTSWYDKKSAYELARIVSRAKGRYGWRHKDIILLAHYKSIDENKTFVVDYILNGMKKLKEKYENKQLNETQQNLLKYLEAVEDFKRCEDSVRAGALAESLNLTLDHVPGHLLKSKEVWESLLFTMSLSNILKNLQRIHNLKFLEPGNSWILKRVLDSLTKQYYRDENMLTPFHPVIFLIALKDYENSGKPLSLEKRKIRESSKTPHQKPPAPNGKVINNLHIILNYSFELLQNNQTNMHYMVTINITKTMMESGCWHCGNVTPIEAGTLIAYSLFRTEKNVTVAAFTNDGIKCIEFAPTFDETLTQLKEFENTNTTDLVDLSKPIIWAEKQKQNIDVFINIVDQIHQKSDTSETSIKNYRLSINQPNVKLVNCAMCASTTYTKDTYDNNILTICGFDEKVPKIIEAFARSFF